MKSPFNRWTLFITYILLGGICFYYISIPDLILFPDKERFAHISYDDHANGGCSQILEDRMSDTAFYIKFELNEGFMSPYVGMSIWDKMNNAIDVSRYNKICLEAEVHNLRGLTISFFAAHTYHQKIGVDPQGVFHSNLDLSSERKKYAIRLDQLKIPDWWYHANELSDVEQIRPDLSKLRWVNIGSVCSPASKGVHSMTVYMVLNCFFYVASEIVGRYSVVFG